MKGLVRCLFFLLSCACYAQVLPLDPALGISTIPLYAGVPPGGNSQDIPTLTVFVPQTGRGNGSAIIIAPGGGYTTLVSNLEGRQVADWFTSRGFTAFVLKYRLGPQNIYPIPLLDAQRAIRLVRSLGKRYDFAPNRIGIVGFSAGGHLAAATATLYHPGLSVSSGSVDTLSDRPDFVVLAYAWLNAMEPRAGKEITYCSNLHTVSPAQCAAFAVQYTPRLHVTSQTPPVFLYATTDDAVVPVSASVEFYEAMIKAGASAEMHLFRHGSHGSGLGSGDASLDVWTGLLEHWLRDQGLLARPTER